jgi:mercuric ion binding protein
MLKMFRRVLLTGVLALGAAPVLADVTTVTLSVPGMYCETCPITAKKALSRVPGVSKVSASYEKKEAIVTYDDSKATVAALTRATANAGYPSTVRQ